MPAARQDPHCPWLVGCSFSLLRSVDHPLALLPLACCTQGMKNAMEQTAKGLLRGSLPKREGSDAWWSVMNGAKVARLPPPT